MEPAKEPEPEGQSDDNTDVEDIPDEVTNSAHYDVHKGAEEATDGCIKFYDSHESGIGVASDKIPAGAQHNLHPKQVVAEAEDETGEANYQQSEEHQHVHEVSASTCPSADAASLASEVEEEKEGEAPFPGPSITSVSPTHAHGFRFRWWRRRHSHDEPETGNENGQLVHDLSHTDASDASLATDSSSSHHWALLDKEGEVVAEDDGLPLSTGKVEVEIEQLLTWMLAPAVHGIQKFGVLSAVDRADAILASVPGRDVEAAVREVVAGSEKTVSSLVSDFCLERIPFLGLPSVLLKTTWGNLRSIFIIAALYGHDLEKPRTHHEALLCLMPPGEYASTPGRRSPAALLSESLGAPSNSKDTASPLVLGTAQQVAKGMIKGALRQATGLQAAGDCFELGALLYNNCVHETADEDGYVCVVATPASAARDFFRRKSLASCAFLWCTLAMWLLGTAAPHIFLAARFLPQLGNVLRELGRVPRWVPATFLALPGVVFAIHNLAGANGGRLQKWSLERLWWRLMRGREARMLQDAWPKIVTMSVFTLHASLPAISAFSAISMVMNSACMAWVEPIPGWDLLHGVAYMMLGLYAFCTCVTQFLRSEKQEAISGEDSSKRLRVFFHFFSVAWVVTRACCILAAWMYALLALDLVATRVESWMSSADTSTDTQQTSALGIIGPLAWLLHAPRDGNPLWSVTAVTFSLSILSVGCQQRLVSLLSRREVLLRLIGAEHITAQTVCLLLKGVAVACSQSTSANPIAEFFEAVTPSPMCCVFVVAVRSEAVVLGSMLVIAPRIVASGVLGSAASFACGSVGGAYVAYAVLRVWYENVDDLDSPPLRLALLVPGSVSGKAKGLLSGAVAGARKMAVSRMAKGLVQRFVRWFFGR